MVSNLSSVSKAFFFKVACLFIYFNINAQHLSSKQIRDGINSFKDSSVSTSFKLQKYYSYKKKFEDTKLPYDSVYAFILHKIGVYEFIVYKDYNKAISFTLASININKAKSKNSSISFPLNSYSNLAYYFKETNLFAKSLQYCDSTILYAKKLNGNSIVDSFICYVTLIKANIFFYKGDYQRCVEECKIGMQKASENKNVFNYLRFLNQRAEAYFYQNHLSESISDVEVAINLKKDLNKPYDLSTIYKLQGLIYAANKDALSAKNAFGKGISLRLFTNDNGQVAEDYNDFGNFYLKELKDFKQVKAYYLKGIYYAQKDSDSLRLAKLNCSLGDVYVQEKNFFQARVYYSKAIKHLKLDTFDFFSNPSSIKVSLIGDKELIITLFKGKTELLLNQYLQNHIQYYLTACLNTALTTDSIINETRHEQLGEKSKLYWRNNTRDFYANALEACYLANNPNLAFFFMEKSRAVLLNDKLNELGASMHLPTNETEKEDSLRSNIIQQEQQLAVLKEGNKVYETQQMKLLNAKADFDNYTQSLEQKFPAYYQYKYNDQVPDLTELQRYLSKNNQAFVHYFITDSIIYILGITPNNTKLIKVSKSIFDVNKLSEVLKMCADHEVLNSHYDAFISLSNSIYTALFKPLQIQQNRVVICADNFLIPFGALCTDNTGNHFLIQDHAFSYAYSARSLLEPFKNPSAKGDLLGIAPVSFAPYLQLPKLKQSADALQVCSKPFNNVNLLLNNDATKYSFIKLLPNYTIVNVFSHASADSSSEEPLLFMADSVIHLSELQKIKSPATQLVVLSACQTNVGKLAMGEGVYSLARGFAASGIPSVAATLWKADEDAIYEITQLFDKNLANGMRKDDALQQAELAYMQHGDDKRLPFFWANMVLVGNAEPVILSTPHHWEIIISIVGVTVLLAAFILLKRRKKVLKKIQFN